MDKQYITVKVQIPKTTAGPPHFAVVRHIETRQQVHQVVTVQVEDAKQEEKTVIVQISRAQSIIRASKLVVVYPLTSVNR